MIIAVDGPSGAGKSTVAKLVSKNLKFEYIDTGAMYRALAYKAYKNHIEINDENIDKMLRNTNIDYINNSIILDGENVDSCIRNENISKLASDISKLRNVRKKMVELQRLLEHNKNVIMDGRDIGKVVVPAADYKFFITASVEERAKRRFKELSEKGMEVMYPNVLFDIIARDKNDSTREISPLKIADDAILLDTTDIDINDAVNKIISIVSEGIDVL